MKKYKVKDLVIEISERENSPATSVYKRFVGLEHYESGNVEIKQSGSVDQLESAMKKFQDGDILIARRNVYLRRAGVVHFSGLTSGDSIVLRPLNQDLKDILPFVFNSDSFWDFANRFADGTMSKRLSPKTLMEFVFELPEGDDLKKLTDMLWAAYELKESYKRLLTASDEMAKSRFVEMFGDQTKERVNLGNYSEITGGITKNAKRENLPLKMPYLRVANVFFNAIDTSELLRIGVTEEEYAKTLLKNNDLLFVEGNGSPDQIGRVALWDARITPCLHQNHLIRVRLDKSFNPRFVLHYFMSQEGRQQIITSAVSTSGLHTLSVGKISKFTLPKPDLKQQNEFVVFIEQLDKSKKALQKSIDNIDTLIKSLLNTINSENTK